MHARIRMTCEWALAPLDSLPDRHFPVAALKFDDKVVAEISVGVRGQALYLRTSEPHPDNDERACVFTLPLQAITDAALKEYANIDMAVVRDEIAEKGNNVCPIK